MVAQEEPFQLGQPSEVEAVPPSQVVPVLHSARSSGGGGGGGGGPAAGVERAVGVGGVGGSSGAAAAAAASASSHADVDTGCPVVRQGQELSWPIAQESEVGCTLRAKLPVERALAAGSARAGASLALQFGPGEARILEEED